MSINVKCTGCGGQYVLKDTQAGMRVKCPRCGATIDVPQPVVTSAQPTPPDPQRPVKPPAAAGPAQYAGPPGQVALPATAKILSNLKLAGIFNILVGILSLLWAILMPLAIMFIMFNGPTPRKKISPSEFWNYAANGHIVGTIIVREKEIEGTLVPRAPGLKKGEPRQFVVQYTFSAESDFDERLQKALAGKPTKYRYHFASWWEGLLPQLLPILVMSALSAACGIVELVAGIKLLKRAPGARKLGLISGFVSCASLWGCCVYPFCLAAGIFTLILLFKEHYRVFLERGEA